MPRDPLGGCSLQKWPESPLKGIPQRVPRDPRSVVSFASAPRLKSAFMFKGPFGKGEPLGFKHTCDFEIDWPMWSAFFFLIGGGDVFVFFFFPVFVFFSGKQISGDGSHGRGGLDHSGAD